MFSSALNQKLNNTEGVEKSGFMQLSKCKFSPLLLQSKLSFGNIDSDTFKNQLINQEFLDNSIVQKKILVFNPLLENSFFNLETTQKKNLNEPESACIKQINEKAMFSPFNFLNPNFSGINNAVIRNHTLKLKREQEENYQKEILNRIKFADDYSLKKNLHTKQKSSKQHIQDDKDDENKPLKSFEQFEIQQQSIINLNAPAGKLHLQSRQIQKQKLRKSTDSLLRAEKNIIANQSFQKLKLKKLKIKKIHKLKNNNFNKNSYENKNNKLCINNIEGSFNGNNHPNENKMNCIGNEGLKRMKNIINSKMDINKIFNPYNTSLLNSRKYEIDKTEGSQGWSFLQQKRNKLISSSLFGATADSNKRKASECDDPLNNVLEHNHNFSKLSEKKTYIPKIHELGLSLKEKDEKLITNKSNAANSCSVHKYSSSIEDLDSLHSSHDSSDSEYINSKDAKKGLKKRKYTKVLKNQPRHLLGTPKKTLNEETRELKNGQKSFTSEKSKMNKFIKNNNNSGFSFSLKARNINNNFEYKSFEKQEIELDSKDNIAQIINFQSYFDDLQKNLKENELEYFEKILGGQKKITKKNKMRYFNKMMNIIDYEAPLHQNSVAKSDTNNSKIYTLNSNESCGLKDSNSPDHSTPIDKDNKNLNCKFFNFKIFIDLFNTFEDDTELIKYSYFDNNKLKPKFLDHIIWGKANKKRLSFGENPFTIFSEALAKGKEILNKIKANQQLVNNNSKLKYYVSDQDLKMELANILSEMQNISLKISGYPIFNCQLTSIKRRKSTPQNYLNHIFASKRMAGADDDKENNDAKNCRANKRKMRMKKQQQKVSDCTNDFNSSDSEEDQYETTGNAGVYKCDICGTGFRSGQGLGGHMSRKHPNQSEKFKFKKLTRENRNENREQLYTAKRILLSRYNKNYDKLIETDEGKKYVKKFCKDHKEEYYAIKKLAKSSEPSKPNKKNSKRY